MSDTAFDLIYRQERDEPFRSDAPAHATFELLAEPSGAWRRRWALRRCLGLRGSLVAAAKVATSRRLLYCVFVRGAVVSYGWLTVGRCRLYPVEERDVVIGPIRTERSERRRGLGSFGVQSAIDAMLARGHRVFFINTSAANAASRRLIARSGFGAPIAGNPRRRR